ncbi:MAG: hypothetical protein DWQ08_11765 [Proteobacteria bacterium]|nr:MAG: hypothetical protein DWQ08_11765 [Pseudomonadota bacterium]
MTSERESPGQQKIPPLQSFGYRQPATDGESCKEIVLLCKTDTMRGAVHVIRQGGGENLHSHDTVDGFWMVLSGKVRFYGDDNRLLGEFGPMQGIMVPRFTRYRFESADGEQAEILQVLHFEPGKGFKRTNHAESNFDRSKVRWYDGRKVLQPDESP